MTHTKIPLLLVEKQPRRELLQLQDVKVLHIDIGNSPDIL